MKLRFPASLRKKFGIKIFAFGACFIFIISLSFTFFFYRHQSRSLTDTLIQNNLLLAGILAYNSRIGVFAESEELLRNPVEGVFQQEEIIEVAVYDLNGRLLAWQAKTGAEDVKNPEESGKRSDLRDAGMLERLRTAECSFCLESGNRMDFWSPVVAGTGHRSAESLFVETAPLSERKRTIGFVRLTVGKATLNERLSALLMQSLLIGIVFLTAGSVIIYFAVKRVVNPLNTLIKGVQTLERGDFGGKVPVETEDEIGELAGAFNQMSETLKRRETEKKQLEERLRHSQRMEAVGTLAGGIAHDFNNILGVIMGYTQMALLTAPEESEMRRRLREIYKAGNRAKDLVQQILTFSRQGYQERNPLLIEPIAEEALKMMRVSLPQGIEIRHNLEKGLSPVLSDPTQIHQVLINLCTNAGHAMQDGGGVLEVTLDEVEIAAGNPGLSVDMQPGRYQILTVSDTGHGMTAAVRERVFDPFFTTKGPGKGTGMGLSVVHGIVKSHGGKINCRSEPGKGTTFDVYFPAIREEAAESSEQGEEALQGGERVLFVDDEAALADIGKQMLQSLGYRVTARTSSIEALEAFRSRPDGFDLLITDNIMPNMSGEELARNVRLIRPDLPVILCTGFSEPFYSANRVRTMGIAGVLMKPIIRENIARQVRRALEQGGKTEDSADGR